MKADGQRIEALKLELLKLALIIYFQHSFSAYSLP